MSRNGSSNLSGRHTRGHGRAGARPPAREGISINDLRSQTAKRAIVVAGKDPRKVPMVVAVCALMLGSGRADFSETEIQREVEALSAELRSWYGFTDEQVEAGLRAWLPIRKVARHNLPPSTYQLWIRSLRPAGLAGGRLWLTGPEQTVGWCRRKYRFFLGEAAKALDCDFEIAFMGLEAKGGTDGGSG
jgi:hypothetical protein